MGVGVGVGEGEGVSVGVGVGVDVGVELGVDVAEGVGVEVIVDVGVGGRSGVGIGAPLGEGVGVGVASEPARADTAWDVPSQPSRATEASSADGHLILDLARLLTLMSPPLGTWGLGHQVSPGPRPETCHRFGIRGEALLGS